MSRTDAAAPLPGAPLFTFLKGLGANNTRAWFEVNKEAYKRDVQAPCLRLVEAFGEALGKISPRFLVDARPIGGALSRINRDTRFSADKSPYKTEVQVRFPHEQSTDETCGPFYYLRLSPKENFLAAGIRHAENPAIEKVRRAIVAKPQAWAKVRAAGLTLEGESLQKVPKGYPADHPWAEDLRRKDFCAATRFPASQVARADFVAWCAKEALAMAALPRFLTEALGFKW